MNSNCFGERTRNTKTKRFTTQLSLLNVARDQEITLELEAEERLMVTFSESLALNAPASSVWQIVREFEHVDRWVIDLASCKPQGQGVGMLRHLVQKDGARVLEQLDGLDESTRTIRYHIVESDLLFSSYSSTIQIKSTGSESCEIIWTSTFEPKNIDKMLKTNYLRYLEKLKMLCDNRTGGGDARRFAFYELTPSPSDGLPQ